MARIRILSWKGIPAQVKARNGGAHSVTIQMPSWFGQEIDRVAMREGLIDTDGYLAAWEWSEESVRPGDPADVARTIAEELAAVWGHPLSPEGEPEDMATE